MPDRLLNGTTPPTVRPAEPAATTNPAARAATAVDVLEGAST
jgi:hypothetical protein